MAIKVDCQHCGKTLTAKDSAAGRTAKCPNCGEPVVLPKADEIYDAEDDFGSLGEAEDDFPSSIGDNQKPCPMCGEMIASVAKKCRHCGEIFDASLKKKAKRASSSGEEEMTVVDGVICVLCPGIGCILGIIRAIQGNATGGKMIGISIGMIIFWNVLKVLIATMVR
ncbi:MAG: hypothetical protein R3C01_17910 [Planctomycetaceae bacterium]